MENPEQKALEATDAALNRQLYGELPQTLQQPDAAPAPAVRRSTSELLEAVFKRLHPLVSTADGGRTPMEKAIDEHHQMRSDLMTLTDEFRLVLHERDVLEETYETEKRARAEDAERFNNNMNSAMAEIVMLREQLAKVKVLAAKGGESLLQMVKACEDAADTNPEGVRAYRPNALKAKIQTGSSGYPSEIKSSN